MKYLAIAWAFIVSLFTGGQNNQTSNVTPTLAPLPTVAIVTSVSPTPYVTKRTTKTTVKPTIKPTNKPNINATNTPAPQNTSAPSSNNTVVIYPTAVPTAIPTTVPTTAPTATPVNQMGFTFSADSLDFTAKNDGSVINLFTFTSTGSTGFSFSGTPQYQGGINWVLSSGAIHSGDTYQQKVQIYGQVPPGVYEGTMVFKDTTTQATKNFPTKIVVTN